MFRKKLPYYTTECMTFFSFSKDLRCLLFGILLIWKNFDEGWLSQFPRYPYVQLSSFCLHFWFPLMRFIQKVSEKLYIRLTKGLHVLYDYYYYLDLDVSYPLTEEYIQLDYRTHKSSSKREYLSHVIKNKLRYNVTKRQNDEELNIMMLMFDSQSHKNIERQFGKTYSYLKKNPYTVILNVS